MSVSSPLLPPGSGPFFSNMAGPSGTFPPDPLETRKDLDVTSAANVRALPAVQNPAAGSSAPPAVPPAGSNWIYLPGMGDPAIQKSECAIDEDLLTLQAVYGFALGCIVMAGLYWTVPAVSLFFANAGVFKWVALSIPPFIPGILEYMRAEQALNRCAAEEFIASGSHCENAMQRLCSEPSAFLHLLSLLPPQNADGGGQGLIVNSNPEEAPEIDNPEPSERVLSKEEGKEEADKRQPSAPSKRKPEEKNLRNIALRDRIFSENGFPSMRGLFIDALSMQSILEKDQSGKSILIRCIELGDIAALDQIAQKSPEGVAFVDLFDEENQIELWNHVRQGKSVRWLSGKGFDIHLGFIGRKLIDRDIRLVDSKNVSESERALGVCLEALKAGTLYEPREIKRPSLKQRLVCDWTWQAREARQQGEAIALALPARRIMEVLFQSIPFQHLPTAYQLLSYLFPSVFPVLSWTRWAILNLFIFFMDNKANESISLRKGVDEYITTPIPTKRSAEMIASSSNAAHFFRSCGWQDQAAVAFQMGKLHDGGGTLLGLAVEHGNIELFSWLLDLNVSYFQGNEKSGFWNAVRSSDPRFLTMIFEKRPLLELTEQEQYDMWLSVRSEEVARFLASRRGFAADTLQQNLDPNTALGSDEPPLWKLIRKRTQEDYDSLEKIRCLLVAGADISLQRGGETLLAVAIEKRDFEVFSLLLEKHPNLFDGERESAFWKAIKADDPRFIKAMFEECFDLTKLENKRKVEALAFAGCEEIAQILREKGFDPKIIPEGVQSH